MLGFSLFHIFTKMGSRYCHTIMNFLLLASKISIEKYLCLMSKISYISVGADD